MKFILISLCLLLGLTGCKTTDNYILLNERYVDNSFDTKRIKWRGTFRDAISIYYVKLYDDHGTLGVCAARVSERTGVFEDLTSEWFEQAFVIIGRRPGKRIASARFISDTDPDLKKHQIKARCIKTTIPVTRDLLLSSVRISGDDLTWYY
ncbi:MAG: hypothetical protein GKS01_11430 [Alphaproteobacteria bacterium]|nr:hypothetical protein [Alphaproteobacteria bacterium]